VLTPVILATQEAEIRSIMVQSPLMQIVCETLSRKNPSQKRTGGVAWGVGPKFKPQYLKKKEEKHLKRKMSLYLSVVFYLLYFTFFMPQDLLSWDDLSCLE
jgi:hypothetical protein